MSEGPEIQGWGIPPRWNCNPRTREENLSGTHDLVGNLEGEVQTRGRIPRQENPYFFEGDGENLRAENPRDLEDYYPGEQNCPWWVWPEWDPQVQDMQDPRPPPQNPQWVDMGGEYEWEEPLDWEEQRWAPANEMARMPQEDEETPIHQQERGDGDWGEVEEQRAPGPSTLHQEPEGGQPLDQGQQPPEPMYAIDRGLMGEQPQTITFLYRHREDDGTPYFTCGTWVPIWFPRVPPTSLRGMPGEELWTPHWWRVRGFWMQLAQYEPQRVKFWHDMSGVSVAESLWVELGAHKRELMWTPAQALYNGWGWGLARDRGIWA